MNNFKHWDFNSIKHVWNNFKLYYQQMHLHIGCPTRYRTRHFFNNFTTNEDIVTKLQHTLQTHSFSFLTQWTYSCSNILSYYKLFIITKEIPGSVASGTHCTCVTQHGTDYELHEDDTIVSKHVVADNNLSINCTIVGQCTK